MLIYYLKSQYRMRHKIDEDARFRLGNFTWTHSIFYRRLDRSFRAAMQFYKEFSYVLKVANSLKQSEALRRRPQYHSFFLRYHSCILRPVLLTYNCTPLSIGMQYRPCFWAIFAPQSRQDIIVEDRATVILDGYFF